PRDYCVTAKRFIGDAAGRVAALETVRIEWVRDNGRFATKEVAGSETTIPATLVLLAMGFLGPEKGGMLDQLGVTLDARGNVATDPVTGMTNVPGVFAAGDMRRGQSLVVWAIAEGRDAARRADRYLRTKA
ncbi:MAG: glutamate synthase, partial [Acidobacteria bacterium]